MTTHFLWLSLVGTALLTVVTSSSIPQSARGLPVNQRLVSFEDMDYPVLLLLAPHGIEAQPRTDPVNVQIVERLIQAAYPELVGQRLGVSVGLKGDLDIAWSRLSLVSVVVLRQGEELSVSAKPDEKTNRLLGAWCHVWMPEGTIELAQFDGTHVHFRELMELRETARKSPNWTDSELAAALQKAGAKYGPADRDGFLKHLEVQRFEPVLGKIERVEAKFLWRLPDSGGDPEEIRTGTPSWSVSLETTRGTGRRVCYGLSFEPFDGRLVYLSGGRCEGV